MQYPLFVFFLLINHLILADGATLEVSLEDVSEYGIFQEVILEKGGKVIDKRGSTEIRHFQFENLELGQYQLIIKTEFSQEFKRSISIDKKKKYKLAYSYKDFFNLLTTTQSLTQAILSQEQIQFFVKIETLTNCTDITSDRLYFIKIKDKLSIIYTQFNTLPSPTPDPHFSVKKEDLNAINLLGNFVSEGQVQKVDCTAGYSGGYISKAIIMVENKMLIFDYCPRKFDGFQRFLKQLQNP